MTEDNTAADPETDVDAQKRTNGAEAAAGDQAIEDGGISRRAALAALGLTGLLGVGATSTASADPQGQIGTSSDPLETLYVEAIEGATVGNELAVGVNGGPGLVLRRRFGGAPVDVELGHHANTVSAAGGVVSGGGASGNANSAGQYAAVGGGQGNAASATNSVIGGGVGNEASDNATVIGGGVNNVASFYQATIGGGRNNEASSNDATVAGGKDNVASAVAAAVGGGQSNVSSSYQTTVAGGSNNEASGDQSTVGGGSNNEASGAYATVPGGSGNSATAPNSFAAGTNASADHEGAFVWCDTSAGGLMSANPNEFVVSAGGGTIFFSDSSATTGVELTSGSGSWSSTSSRTLKSDVDPVDGEDVLEQVTDLEISRWTYDSQPGVRHMGPMAEAFHDAFGLGDDEQQISNVDADGVALGAIQGLAKRLEDVRSEADERVAEAKQRVGDAERRVAETEARVEHLEAENDALRKELDDLRETVQTLQDAAIAADGGELR